MQTTQGVVSNEVSSRHVGLIKFCTGRGGEISLLDNKAYKLRDGLVLGVEGEREVNGAWRRMNNSL